VRARTPGAERSAHFDEAEVEALGDARAAVLEGAAELVDEVVRLTPSPVTKLQRARRCWTLGAAL
jgi:hypothetical protein